MDLAHRSAWRIAIGPIPEGAQVLHKCDNPPCVNPRHLFLGDCTINAQDKVTKGRIAATPYSPRMTDDVVRTIRTRRTMGESVSSIAGSMQLREMTVWNIVWEKTYRKVV